MTRRGGPPESAVLAQCLDLLRLRGVLHWRQNAAAVPLPGGGFRRFNGLKGVSDILAVIPPAGTLVAIEVKRPVGGRVSAEQAAFLGEVSARGGIGVVIRDVRELDELLRREGV